MKLSVLIPARNEQFLAKTIEDLLSHSEADIEVIAVLDGKWANPVVPQDPRVNVVYLPESIGQRKATDVACKLARGKYVAKVDAHCAFDQGWDRKMIEFMEKHGDDVTAVPIMRNLWAFDWKCMKCGKKWYQGPTPTECKETNFKGTGKKCESKKFTKKIMWIGKANPQSWSYCFDATPHFQYFNEYKDRPGVRELIEKEGYSESMSLQGSFFMCTREKYWELDLGGDYGSWGNQGIQVACATWLSGGRVLVNHNTWYAHMFRTQGGDFGFPYENSGRKVQKTKDTIKELFWTGKYPGQKLPISWLVEKFAPVRHHNPDGWTIENIQKLKEYERA